MLTEVIRLPVRPGGEQALLAAIDGLPYFGQDGLTSARRFVAVDEPAVLLLFEWTSREAARAAIASEQGAQLLEALRPHLTGAPELAFYRAAS